MKKTEYDMIYLAACGINGVSPDKNALQEPDMEKLYRLSYAHFMDALVGTALKQAGVSLPKAWNEHISKAVRKVVLFDAERAKLFGFMEQKGIWYLPLKGIVLKDYYPAVGMRQMSDNDILFDYSFCDEVQEYMESQGYEAVSVGVGNHDVYKKEPVYNFELHSALYGAMHQNNWEDYYKDVKDRLVLDNGSSYGYHFTDEDFYVYIVTHAHKHYAGSGTGLRTLLDFYVYLRAKEPELDFTYIEKECEVLGIAEFERQNRTLCRKVFDAGALYDMDAFEKQLSHEEQEMLYYYLSSGVYGTVERGVENRVKKYRSISGKRSKVGYLFSRLFPGMDTYKHYPFFYKHKLLLPVCWVYRVFRVLFSKERREQMVREIKVVKRIE